MSQSKREQIMERYNAAQQLLKMHRFEEAANYLQDCFLRCEETGDSASCETILGELAACHQKAGNLDQSVQVLGRLLVSIRHEGPTQKRAIVHHNLGHIYQLMQDFENAQDHFRRSSEIAGEAGDYRGQGLSLAMLAQVLACSQRIESAMRIFIRAIAVLQRAEASELDQVIDHTREVALGEQFNGLELLARERITDEAILARLLA